MSIAAMRMRRYSRPISTMPRQTTPSELLIRQRLNALTRSLPGAQQGDAKLLHRARVATRRLREALPLVTRGARGRKLKRTVRRLTRALGPVRELEVALETLEALAAAGEVPRGAMTKLRQVIREERQRLWADMRSRVARVDLDKLRHRAAAAARKGHAQTARGRIRDPKRIADARARAARRAVRLREAVENAAGIYLPDRLHEVRIAVKKLRYAMEVSREVSGSRGSAGIRALKNAQDLLGRVHDHEMLIARVRAVQGSPQAPNLRVSGDLDLLVRRLETECRQLHGQYMATRRKLVAICDRSATRPGTTAGDAARGLSAA
jgi:CHAD domain-containing protein